MSVVQRTVMIIDDEPDVLDMVSVLLSSDGYRVFVAATGREALQLLQAERPDLILLDIMMPEMDGHEVCRRIRHDNRLAGVPVIMLTAKNDVSHIAEAVKSGAEGFVVKPFDTEELLALVASRLRGDMPAFYRGGRQVMPDKPWNRSGQSRVALFVVSEPDAPFSAIVDACGPANYDLLSLWQAPRGAMRMQTTGLVNIESADDFGRFLNGLFACKGVDVQQCTIYRSAAEVPLKMMDGNSGVEGGQE